MKSKTTFFVALIVIAGGMLSPPFALLAGIAYAFFFSHPYAFESKHLSRFLLQAAIVALGFGMNVGQVIRVGKAGFVYTAISISTALLLGWLLGRMMGVAKKVSFLISVGTAICGGSAIAAIAPITHPDEEEMAMSLGTVFILNSVALLLFPVIGTALHLTQPQFGLWCALAIHDTSSVVGAAAKYGSEALMIGTTVKLARALWIVPIAAITAALTKSKGRTRFPWFIVLFCLAALANSYLPAGAVLYPAFSRLGRLGLTVVLFLIGTGLSKETVSRVGVRPFLQGVALWAVVATASLLAIRSGLIHL